MCMSTLSLFARGNKKDELSLYMSNNTHERRAFFVYLRRVFIYEESYTRNTSLLCAESFVLFHSLPEDARKKEPREK